MQFGKEVFFFSFVQWDLGDLVPLKFIVDLVAGFVEDAGQFEVSGDWQDCIWIFVNLQ